MRTRSVSSRLRSSRRRAVIECRAADCHDARVVCRGDEGKAQAWRAAVLILLDLPRRKEPFHGRHDICIVQQITTLLQVITKFNGHHNLSARGRIASRPTTPTLLRTYVKAEEGKSVASSKNFGNSFALSCSDLRYCSDVPRARARERKCSGPSTVTQGSSFGAFRKGTN